MRWLAPRDHEMAARWHLARTTEPGLTVAAAAWAGLRNRLLGFDPRQAFPDVETRPAVRDIAA